MKKILDIANDIQSKNEQKVRNLEETLLNQVKASETNFLNSLEKSEALMKTALRKEQPIADRDNKYLRSDPIKHREVDSIKSESRQSQDIHFNSRNNPNNNPDYFDGRELVAQQVRSETLRREGGITAGNRENAHRAQNIGENQLSGGQGDDLHQNEEASRSKRGFRGLDHLENEKVIKQWTKDELLERGLTDKQADYCLKSRKKAFNPMWAEDAQLRQLEKIQDRLNTQIENGTVGKDQDREIIRINLIVPHQKPCLARLTRHPKSLNLFSHCSAISWLVISLRIRCIVCIVDSSPCLKRLMS